MSNLILVGMYSNRLADLDELSMDEILDNRSQLTSDIQVHDPTDKNSNSSFRHFMTLEVLPRRRHCVSPLIRCGHVPVATRISTDSVPRHHTSLRSY